MAFWLAADIREALDEIRIGKKDVEGVLDTAREIAGSRELTGTKQWSKFAAITAGERGVGHLAFRRYCEVINLLTGWRLSYVRFCSGESKDEIRCSHGESVAEDPAFWKKVLPPLFWETTRKKPFTLDRELLEDSPKPNQDSLSLDQPRPPQLPKPTGAEKAARIEPDSRPASTEAGDGQSAPGDADESLAASNDNGYQRDSIRGSLDRNAPETTVRGKSISWAAVLAVSLIVLIAGLAFFWRPESSTASLPDPRFGIRVLAKNSEESVAVSDSKLPITPGDALQFTVACENPSYFYVFWLDAGGTVTPVWPWKDFSWDKLPTETRKTELRFPEGLEHFKLQPDTEGVHAVVLVGSSTPISDTNAIRTSLEELAYKQTELPTIFSKLLVRIEDGKLVPTDDRFPINSSLRRNASHPVLQLEDCIRRKLVPLGVSVDAICFAFGERYE